MSYRQTITYQVGTVYFDDLAGKQYTKDQIFEVIKERIDQAITNLGPFDAKGAFLTFSFEDDSGDGDSGPNYQLRIYMNRPEDDNEYRKRIEKEDVLKRKKLKKEQEEKELYLKLKEKYERI